MKLAQLFVRLHLSVRFLLEVAHSTGDCWLGETIRSLASLSSPRLCFLACSLCLIGPPQTHPPEGWHIMLLSTTRLPTTSERNDSTFSSEIANSTSGALTLPRWQIPSLVCCLSPRQPPFFVLRCWCSAICLFWCRYWLSLLWHWQYYILCTFTMRPPAPHCHL